MKKRMHHPVKQKLSRKKLVDKLVDQRKEIISLRGHMRKVVGEEVQKYVDSYMNEVTHIKKEYGIWRKILIRKGLLSHEEINEELRKL